MVNNGNEVYVGDTWMGLRHGKGRLISPNDEVYEGYWYYGLKHGPGRLTFSDGSVYIGYFFCDGQEGYGTKTFPNGEVYQGLFRQNQSYGIGVLSYPDNRQDVGLFQGNHLLQLMNPVSEAYRVPYLTEIMANCPFVVPLTWNPREQLLQSTNAATGDQLAAVWNVLMADKQFQLTAVPLGEVALVEFREIMDLEFAKHLKYSTMRKDIPETETFANNSDILMEMHKFITKMHPLCGKMEYDVDLVNSVDRIAHFAAPGRKETEAISFVTAAAHGNMRLVQDLLFLTGVNVDVCDGQGLTALMAASLNGRTVIAETLLNFGADLSRVTNHGYNVMELCCYMYHIFVEKYNQWRGKDPEIPTLLNNSLEGSLIFDASASLSKLASVVPQRLSTPNPATNQSDKPKSSSAGGKAHTKRQGPDPEMRLDVDQKGSFKTDQTFKKVPVDVQNQQFVSVGLQMQSHRSLLTDDDLYHKPEFEKPLFLVWLREWQHRIKDVIMALIGHGANWKKCIWPLPMLYVAIRASDGDLVKLLLEQGSDSNELLTRQNIAVTPLMVACSVPGKSAPDVVDLLLENSANPNAIETDTRPPPTGKEKVKVAPFAGRYVMHIACQREPNELVAVHILNSLIKHGARVDVTWNRLTPLAMSIQQGSIKMVETLLAAGSDENQDLTGGLGNALCVAATLATADVFLRTNKEVGILQRLVEVLLQHNADFTVKIALTSTSGNSAPPLGSPLDYAKQVYGKQTLGANMNPQLKNILENFRSFILDAYKDATQRSVLRLRKISLAGAIYPEIVPLLRQQPQLIDASDPLIEASLYENAEIRPLLKVLPGLRAKINQISRAEDTVKDGKVVRPTLTVMRNPLRPDSDEEAESGSYIPSPESVDGSLDNESFVTEDELVITHRSVLGVGGLNVVEVSQKQKGKKGKLGKPITDPDHVGLLVPAVHIIDENGDDIPIDHTALEYEYCSCCGESSLPNRALFPCPNCEKIFYCSQKCLDAHWPAHQANCLEISKRKHHVDLYHKKIRARKRRRRLTGDDSETEYTAIPELDSEACSIASASPVSPHIMNDPFEMTKSDKTKWTAQEKLKYHQHSPKGHGKLKPGNKGVSKPGTASDILIPSLGTTYSSSTLSFRSDKSDTLHSPMDKTQNTGEALVTKVKGKPKDKENNGTPIWKQAQSKSRTGSKSLSPYSDEKSLYKPVNESKQRKGLMTEPVTPKMETAVKQAKTRGKSPHPTPEKQLIAHSKQKQGNNEFSSNGLNRSLKMSDDFEAIAKKTTNKQSNNTMEVSALNPQTIQNSKIARQNFAGSNVKSLPEKFEQFKKTKRQSPPGQVVNKNEKADNTAKKKPAKKKEGDSIAFAGNKLEPVEKKNQTSVQSRQGNAKNKTPKLDQKYRREELSLAARLKGGKSPKPETGSKSQPSKDAKKAPKYPPPKEPAEQQTQPQINPKKGKIRKHANEPETMISEQETKALQRDGKISRRKRREKKTTSSPRSDSREPSRKGRRSGRKRKKNAPQKYWPSDTDIVPPKKNKRPLSAKSPKLNKAYILPSTMRKSLIKIKRLSHSKPAWIQREAQWIKVIRAINQLRMDEDMRQLFNGCYEALIEKGMNLASPYDIVELANGEFYTAVARQRKVTVTQVVNIHDKMLVSDFNKANNPSKESMKEITETVKSQMIIMVDQPETYFSFEKVNVANYSFS
ncbi:uncharacterized protein LOC129590275 [Paramacrobiotus metropolitanus]|uniref:uncharacterized protein LOC129590275 n=1 Tax=Paramacrobiotus metropolitanus TaxID=2943436 RepID=UPI0024459FE4|nr:uncharacterized protein LOC129590275 [Paramacrobiotus metropolitanus]XP_055341398.1 uncharacterized protein LOC129590275 [Paramacrobiotus metropolitanus]